MGGLRVPEESYKALERIWNIPDEPNRQLLAALRNVPLTVPPSTLAAGVSKQLPSFPTGELDDLLDALFSLSMVRTGANVELPEFVDDVHSAVQRIPKGTLSLPEEHSERFKARLIELLELDSIALASKALSVMVDHEHSLCSARIFSDIRPIFGASVGEPPRAAVVMHTLKLNYHRSQELEEFFVAMDTDQLTELGEIISRALTKAEALKSLLTTAKIACIDPE